MRGAEEPKGHSAGDSEREIDTEKGETEKQEKNGEEASEEVRFSGKHDVKK